MASNSKLAGRKLCKPKTAALRTPSRGITRNDVVALAFEAEEGRDAAQQPAAKEVLMEPPASKAQAHEHREPDGRCPLPGEGRAARER